MQPSANSVVFNLAFVGAPIDFSAWVILQKSGEQRRTQEFPSSILTSGDIFGEFILLSMENLIPTLPTLCNYGITRTV